MPPDRCGHARELIILMARFYKPSSSSESWGSLGVSCEKRDKHTLWPDGCTLRKKIWFPWLRCSLSLVALGSRAMPRPCWNFVTCDRFISDLLKCSGQVTWHWTSPRLPSRSLDGSFTILANLASILAKENSHLFTFALVQLKFVRRTHRDSATIRWQSLESCFLDS